MKFVCITLGAVLVSVFAPVHAQQLQSSQGAVAAAIEAQAFLQRDCARKACQRNVPITIRDQQGNQYSKTFELLPPAVQGNAVTLLNGQRIHFEGTLRGGKLVDLRQVSSVTAPARTITVQMTQSKDGKTTYVMSNPFAQPIKFQVGVTPLGSRTMQQTLSCPIRPGKTATIHWDRPVLIATARAGVALSPNGPLKCS